MRRRPGVTLIELLVVIAIITALATMIVAIAPRFGERQRASRGASQLQSWLNLAKQRALRDRRPVGIRMPIVTGTSASSDPRYQFASQYVREVMYVEVPDEGIGGTMEVPFDYEPIRQNPNRPPYPSSATEYQFVNLQTTVLFDPTLPTALLQPGDVITFTDRQMANYLQRRIIDVQKPPSGSPVPQSTTVNGVTYYNYRIQLDQILPPAQFATRTFVVSRRARPVVGEPVLQLPKDIAIDISRQYDPTKPNALPTWYRMFPPTSNTGGGNPFDILFSPAGQVIGAEGNLGSRICLWVRDVSINTPSSSFNNDPMISEPFDRPPGYNTLITIYTRTGHVTAHEINPAGLIITNTNPWNPFLFTQDGLTSGY
jgi:prepilin-type N-terminal cleavage/methylation domain-containing protein